MSILTVSRRSVVAGAALAGVGLVATAAMQPLMAKASETAEPEAYDFEADVVIVGAGGAGLIAAMKASDEGAKVIVVDANYDMGGHACLSSGYTHSGCGTSVQQVYGVEDSPDQYYLDHTNPACLDSRFNDRDVIRGEADYMAEAFEWMLTKGLKVQEGEPFFLTKGFNDGGADCNTVPRDLMTDPTGLTEIGTGLVNEGMTQGIALTRPFEEQARAQGVDFIMNYHMDSLICDESGRVVGIRASKQANTLPDGTALVGLHDDENLTSDADEICVKGAKAVVLCTGGSAGSVPFRTMLDPRWTEEYGINGAPYGYKDASGEIAAMAVGAGLGSTANGTVETRMPVMPRTNIGCKYQFAWGEQSQMFPIAGAKGLRFNDYDGAILVNMLGQRFANEATAKVGVKSMFDYLAAALGSVVLDEGTGAARRVGGPIWCIFDAAYAEEQGWDCQYPNVDTENGCFFQADTIEDLASQITCEQYGVSMDPATLAQTVADYNACVDAGADEAFGKDAELLTRKVENGPFYAALATPILHDSLTGIRVNGQMQVLSTTMEVIPGLYAAGECAGGHHTHGMGKVETQGYIAGMFAGQE